MAHFVLSFPAALQRMTKRGGGNTTSRYHGLQNIIKGNLSGVLRGGGKRGRKKGIGERQRVWRIKTKKRD